ncbi:MAG: aminomethyl-transferring glycine dehydrogenase subunit GcvPA [Rhodospirillales bacterium]|nr:aminomethyl-transferring glycine dehydrogenase subunit GcvPA [Rhodospirillales bacterium]
MRYLPLTDTNRREMLDVIGAGSIEDLFCDVPEAARLKAPLELPNSADEQTVEAALRSLANKNISPSNVPSFLGAGIYHHHIPAAVDHLIQRGEFLTAYTPYQPEVSQGTLQAMFEFQTQVAMLTGMDVANASLYDGATACAEAVLMAQRVTRRTKAILSGALHPHYRDVTETSARFMGSNMIASAPDQNGDEDLISLIDEETACVVAQNPGFFGHVRDLTPLAEACHDKGALLVVIVTEIFSLGAIKSPGDMGADIVAAEGQSLGNSAGFGGPTVGLMAVRQKFLRQLPGRLVGQTVDADGKRGFVLTLSTREQHIRREKATSNICTNAGLCALAFSIHLSQLGEAGFTGLAKLNHARAVQLSERLSAIDGLTVLNDTFFNEFTIALPKLAAGVIDELAGKDLLGGVPVSRLYPNDSGLEALLLVAATETTTDADMTMLIDGLVEVLK